MTQHSSSGLIKASPSSNTMRLYRPSGKGGDSPPERLYISQSERERLIALAEHKAPSLKAFILTLIYTGCRISEALELTERSLQKDDGILSIRTLKRRSFHVREIPIPPHLISALVVHLKSMPPSSPRSAPLWQNEEGETTNRITAYRWIKEIMGEANIHGACACPKGLRHGFGIHAVSRGVPLNLVAKWMGHSNINTTTIYTNAVGREEKEMAGRMWG